MKQPTEAQKTQAADEDIELVNNFAEAIALIATRPHPGPGLHWAFCKQKRSPYVEVYIARNAAAGF